MTQKRKRKGLQPKTIIILTVVLFIVALAVFFGLKVLRKNVMSSYGNRRGSEVLSVQVKKGSISTTVSGTGTLEDEEYDEIEIPSSVNIKEILVEAGNKVQDGDILATVYSSSVMEAMSELQVKIDEIDEKLAKASDDEVPSSIKAPVAGRLKKIYAGKNADVAGIMYEHGSLMLLSLDGYMAAEIETDRLNKGDNVRVVLSDGREISGTVESSIAGTAIILVSDKDADFDEKVSIKVDDEEIGTGNLYIHKALAVTGYAGTVSSVNVKENDTVKKGTVLVKLTDTAYSANYSSLLQERDELEEELSNLIAIYKEGAVFAHCSGTVKEVSEPSAESSADAYSSYQNLQSQYSAYQTTVSSDNTVIYICRDNDMYINLAVDESDILSVEPGEKASVTIDSLNEGEFEGVVTEVDTSGTSTNGVTTYTVRIKISRSANMRAGMSCKINISIEGIEDTLYLPVDAVHKTSSSAYVYTTYDEETGTYGGMKEVTLGISNGTECEIKTGLSEGETVYYTEAEKHTGFQWGNFSGMGGGNYGGQGYNGFGSKNK